MPSIDLLVLLGVVLGTAALVWLLRQRGARGARLATAAWTGFFGVAVTVSMAAHCVDVLGRLAAGTGHDGKPFPYDFRAYALLLLGALMLAQGGQVLRGALQLADGARVHGRVLRPVGIVAALALPLIPIHAVFALPVSTLAVLTLLVLELSARLSAPAEQTPESAALRGVARV